MSFIEDFSQSMIVFIFCFLFFFFKIFFFLNFFFFFFFYKPCILWFKRFLYCKKGNFFFFWVCVFSFIVFIVLIVSIVHNVKIKYEYA